MNALRPLPPATEPPTAQTNGTALAVEVQGLCKSFEDQVVLDHLNFAVAPGTIFALLGPNGSGKTTTIRILSTLLPADAGVVRVEGHDVGREPGLVRDVIGVTGQFSAVDNLLTGEENLLLMADLAHLGRADGRRRAAELLDRFDLSPPAKKMVATYSGGMRRRLDLAMTLMGMPRVIFLDEPTTGLDPRGRRTMWQIIRELATGGVTILLTTQYLEEADQLADQIAVLNTGRVVGEGTPAELKRVIPGGHVELHFAQVAAWEAAAGIVGRGDAASDATALTLRIPTDGSVAAVRALLGRLEDQSVPVETLSVHTADLDDVFFALTGSAGREGVR